MKVGLVGAFDRNNFGDLLMPIVFERQYKYLFPDNTIEFKYFGQLNRDMSSLKGYNTEALYDCYDKCDIVIIVGGEVLSSTYKLMYLNLQKNGVKIFFIRCLNRIFSNFVEKISRNRLRGREISPWILDKNKLNCKKLIYNTVGGYVNNIKEYDYIKKIDYISTRSKPNYDELKKYYDKVKLYPDSVTPISELISDKEIDDNTCLEVKKITQKAYFVLQTDYRNNKNNLKEIAEQVEKVCNECNINCILLPIGYAQGHEDQKALKRIRKHCKNKEQVLMPRMTNIYETLFIMKKAQVFIGTSLHGIIISTSYGIPHMVLTNKIKKLIDYVETWETTSVHYTNIEDILDNFKMINSDEERKKVLMMREKLVNLSLENFDNINAIINEEYINE